MTDSESPGQVNGHRETQTHIYATPTPLRVVWAPPASPEHPCSVLGAFVLAMVQEGVGFRQPVGRGGECYLTLCNAQDGPPTPTPGIGPQRSKVPRLRNAALGHGVHCTL